MSRHRIVHTFNASDIVSEFDGDDYEDEVEDELSPEDRQAMEEGTAEVRRALGTEANKVTKAQIEEALWHYYYDIDKSVTYLMKTFIAPAPKPAKKAPEGMSVFFSASQRLFGTGADHRRLSNEHTSIMDPPPALGVPAWHFDDMPWMNVPEERRTVFIEPERPRGGLLGGGEGPPKMSKLQALAAARKKKTEEKKELERAGKGLERLSINESQKENQPVLGQARQAPEPTLQVRLPPQEESTEAAAITDNQKDINSDPKGWLMDEGLPVMMPRAAPSAFARTLFGSAPSKAPRPDEIFAMPYTSSPIYVAEAFAEPSPDDVVLAAQAKAGKKPVAKAPKKAQKEKDKDVSQVEKDAAELNVVEAPPPKSKGLDVLKEYENSSNKRSISFVVVGHVDAGKSTLMGRLLLELKFVEKHTIDRYRKQAEKSGKQSFALAWVMDQRSEERERGVTIDIATNHFETEKTSFTILDAPGHRDFVPNMIAGASQADFAILVIDANTGAYEKGLKGQTREHVFLLRSLGVQRLVIAVNKLDMVGWSQERFDEIAQQVNAFLAGLGFQPKNIDFIPISGLNGDNLVRRTEDTAASWYTGPTLIEALENSEPSTTRALKNPFRMAISEVFRSQLGTTTIAGRVDSGSVQIGDALLVQPSGEEAYVKSIMVDSDMQDWAVAGQSVSVALTNIDPIHIRVGDMLCHTKDPISCGDTFTLKAMAFEHLMPMPVDLHRGRLHSAGQIVSITATLDKATGAIVKKKPRVVQPGGVARVVIKLAAKVPLESGQRVVIRSGGETVAAGLLE
ncbi:elongation factor 1-alpha [Fusarium tjaetaba]|uniref:Elongation factor 1 alpha-like protein n=1 Tax=Fusarium tjaetaba TaxID=1567544 RepID=A0A8H5V814_9HYPO|nr:elongation factor 1-alpha [Fusarium tjaetaba]KAF5612215.1 elongation factor 1-alpha [Fusarium tjaetaba]